MHGTPETADAQPRADDTKQPAAAVTPSRRHRIRPVLTISIAAVLTVVVAVTLTTLSRPSHSLPAARSFSLASLDSSGGRISLAQYQGRPVLINFFASWCAPCKKETPLLEQFYRAHHGKVAVLGVDSNDQQSAALAFLRSEGVSYPVGADPFPATVASEYGIVALPQTFLLNSRHQIVRQISGDVTLPELNSWVAATGG